MGKHQSMGIAQIIILNPAIAGKLTFLIVPTNHPNLNMDSDEAKNAEEG
ncbi:hypothetical protein [Anaerocolumna jejuensis]|nr:hypothetical protein [Anaerocolumna jejuensis]